MRRMEIGRSGLQGSVISLGCMRISWMTDSDVDAWLSAGQEVGYNLYDHADIYGGGKSEEVFAAALKRSSIRRSRSVEFARGCLIFPGSIFCHRWTARVIQLEHFRFKLSRIGQA